MKTPIRFSTLLAACAVGLSACSKTEPETPKTTEAPKAAQPTAAGIAEAAKSGAETARTAVQNTAAEVQKAAEIAKTQTSAQAQSLIDKVKALMAEKKYQDGLASLQELSKLKLTPEQEKVLASLKEQIQKAMATQASGDPGKAVGNLLGK